MNKCVQCSKIIERKKDLCGNCGCYNFEVEPFQSVPEAIKKKVIENYSKKPIRKMIDKSELDLLLNDSLKVCKFNSEYDLKETNNWTNNLSITPTENGFDLYYNPLLLRKFNDDELKAMMRHEIFHPITVGPLTDLEKFPDIEKLLLKIFVEMLNYKKYVNQIPDDVELRKIKRQIAYEGTFSLLVEKNIIKHSHNLDNGEDQIMGQLLKSLELLIYYFYEDGKTIMALIKKYDLQAIWDVYSWINHDISYIQKNIFRGDKRFEIEKLEKTMALLRLVFSCMSNLILKNLFLENKIQFSEDFIEKILTWINSNELDQNKESMEILKFWQERVLQYTK